MQLLWQSTTCKRDGRRALTVICLQQQPEGQWPVSGTWSKGPILPPRWAAGHHLLRPGSLLSLLCLSGIAKVIQEQCRTSFLFKGCGDSYIIRFLSSFLGLIRNILSSHTKPRWMPVFAAHSGETNLSSQPLPALLQGKDWACTHFSGGWRFCYC